MTTKKLNHPIEVVPYDTTWPEQFKSEMELLKPLFQDNLVQYFHFGSTAIPNMPAKPTIDMMIEVKDISKIDALNSALAELGYDAMGEYGISGRRFFIKGEEKRTHHLHVYQTGNPNMKSRAFVEYFIANPEDAKAYALLKIDLAKKYPNNRQAYTDGKNAFLDAIEKKNKHHKL